MNEEMTSRHRSTGDEASFSYSPESRSLLAIDTARKVTGISAMIGLDASDISASIVERGKNGKGCVIRPWAIIAVASSDVSGAAGNEGRFVEKRRDGMMLECRGSDTHSGGFPRRPNDVKTNSTR